MTATSFYQQQAANRRNSIVLVLIVVLILATLGFVIGYAIGGNVQTAVIVLVGAVALALLMTAGSYFSGDSLVLTVSQAREVTEDQAPQLVNVVK